MASMGYKGFKGLKVGSARRILALGGSAVLLLSGLIGLLLAETPSGLLPLAESDKAKFLDAAQTDAAPADKRSSDLLAAAEQNLAQSLAAERPSDAESTSLPATIVVPRADCPLPLPPEQQQQLTYYARSSLEVWQTDSPKPCRDYARSLLLGLREAPFQLVQAGYLDLGGNAWGCTLRANDGSAYLVVLRSASDNREAAVSSVSVLHLWVPEGVWDEAQ